MVSAVDSASMRQLIASGKTTGFLSTRRAYQQPSLATGLSMNLYPCGFIAG
jgi:hypothetical protein